MMGRLAIWLLLCLISQPAFSQLSSKRCKWVTVSDHSFTLDTLTLSPQSVEFFDRKNRKLSFRYDPSSGEFTLLAPAFEKPAPPEKVDTVLVPGWQQLALDSARSLAGGALPAVGDSVLVCYRVLGLNLAASRYRRDVSKLDSSSFLDRYYVEDFSVKEEIFRTPGLNKTGSISRGISFGNTQNVFVNSALNLQLEGKLTEDISITASVTDQNIPFQPEGNTQQLQDFDRVYITLQHRLWNLTAGDIVLQNKPSSFLRFYKNVQGGALEVTNTARANRASSTTAAASVAKGKFASLPIQPIESVQGPYRLRGPNGEKFIMVLANSERVYLDGRLLTRGFDFDYVIDYNQAEITFTPRHVITKNSRIRVDYEYSDRNYSRSIFHLSHYQTLNKFRLHTNYYNESDNPNNPLYLQLDASQKLLLSSIGDNLSQAVVPGADSVQFTRNQVLYAKVDTVYDQLQHTIYAYSTDSTKAHFLVNFTDAGANRGDYVLETSTVNGRVFRWVPPLNGVPQGRYVPLRVLATPTKKQLVTLGGSYELDQKSSIFFETAASQLDLNRFSDLDAGDDNGKAVKLGYLMEDKAIGFLPQYKLRSSLTYEYTDQHFSPIDRYRDIEFDRDWSLSNTSSKVSDNIFNLSVGAVQDAFNQVNYRLSRRYRQNEVDGMQHWLDLAKQVKRLEIRSSFFKMNSTQQNTESDWVRGEVGVRLPTAKVVPGYQYRFDKNTLSRLGQDSVIGTAMYFDEHLVFVQSPDTARTRFRLDYSHRVDQRPERGEMQVREKAHTYNGNVITRLGKTNDLSLLITYRNLSSRDTINESTLLAKADWNGDFFDRHLRSELSYTVATGREVRREYVFVQVPAGEGTHWWEDLNSDKVQDLNEFFEVQEPDRRLYIKLFLPTDEYVKAYTNRFTYRLNSSMPRNWRSQGGLKEWASRFSALTFALIDRKTTDNQLLNRINPFAGDIDDQFLLSLSQSLRNTVYYNRSNPKYGLEFTSQHNLMKSLLTNGTDTRNLTSQTLIGRINLNEVLSSKVQVARTRRENTSNYLVTRNFSIVGYEFSPELAYQPTNYLRFTTTYLASSKENVFSAEANEKAVSQELGLETRLSQVQKRTLMGTVRYINIGFTGDERSVVAYEMLNALRPGNNVTWSLNLQQRLSNGLNVSVNYDGRKPNQIRAIHTGRMQVSVLF
jgi:hypothetical protein